MDGWVVAVAAEGLFTWCQVSFLFGFLSLFLSVENSFWEGIIRGYYLSSRIPWPVAKGQSSPPPVPHPPPPPPPPPPHSSRNFH